ncbi:hypothetical protein SNE40_013683 [Patella caerulea]|uniref:G-protein coupled receptors family 1 profile domain-containing protein n=1 Tax=Patella caerulea TaxID=87958 RepID=A0AAN8JGI0_PATCE
MALQVETRSTSLFEDYLLVVYLAVTFLLSTSMTGLVCYFFHKKPHLLTVSNGFVLNLICSEQCFTVLLMTFSVTSLLYGSWIYSDVLCRVQGYLVIVMMTTIQGSSVIIALDRKFAINNSLRYAGIFNQSLGVVMIALTWAIGLLLGFPALIGWSAYEYNEALYMCTPRFGKDMGYSVLFLLVVFVIPFLVGCVCYACVFVAALSHTKRSVKIWPVQQSTTSTAATTNNSRHQENGNNDTSSSECESSAIAVDKSTQQSSYRPQRNITRIKTVKTLLLVCLGYVTSWLPLFVIIVKQTANMSVSASFGKFTMAMLMTSAVFMQIVYVILNRTSRKELWKCLQTCSSKLFKSKDSSNIDIKISTISSNPSTSTNLNNGGNHSIIKDSILTPDVLPTIEETELEMSGETLFRIHPFSFRKPITQPHHLGTQSRIESCDLCHLRGSEKLPSIHVTVDPVESRIRKTSHGDLRSKTFHPTRSSICNGSDVLPSAHLTNDPIEPRCRKISLGDLHGWKMHPKPHPPSDKDRFDSEKNGFQVDRQIKKNARKTSGLRPHPFSPSLNNSL